MKRIGIPQMVNAVAGRLIGEEWLKEGYVKKVVRDSREVTEGTMYVALVGERVDGHDYIGKAFEQGAFIAMADKADMIPDGRPVILVDDCEKALGDLAAYYRAQFDIPFIGITGSVGKTSTKEMIASILGSRYKVHKTGGNYNNNIGMPLTLLQLEEGHEVAVIEMGMDRFGEIDYLSGILKPEYGVITNIGVSHIEFLGSREGILKAKTEMVPHIKDCGRILLNGDDDMLQTVIPGYGRKVLTFGNGERNDCRIINHETSGDGQKLTVSTSRNIYNIEVDYPGEHLLFNGLPGILLGEMLGLSKEEIIQGIQTYEGAAMRLQMVDAGGAVRIIDDAYNASVESMQSGLRTLMSVTVGGERSVAVLGSMFEMGSYSVEGHSQVGRSVAAENPDLLLVSGDEARAIYVGALEAGYDSDRAYYYETRDDLIENLDRHIKENDVVLLKASRGMHYEAVRDYIKGKFEGE